MWIFLRHHFSFRTSENSDAFLKRLNDHATASKSLNFLTATIQDYGITAKFKDRSIFIKDMFGRENYRILMIVSEISNGSKVDVLIKPSIMIIPMLVLLAVFSFIMPIPLLIKAVFIMMIYVFRLIALGFKVWWAKNFIAAKLMVKDFPKD